MTSWIKLLLIALMPAALAAAAPPVPGNAGVDVTLKRAYAGYFKASGGEGGDWDQPVWSARTTRLIRQWKRHNGGELTGLSSYGWLCECQDWQWQKFAWQRAAIKPLAPGKLEVTVKVNPGFGDFLTQRLIMVREGKRWLIDDLVSESAPAGVRAGMLQELTEEPGS